MLLVLSSQSATMTQFISWASRQHGITLSDLISMFQAAQTQLKWRIWICFSSCMKERGKLHIIPIFVDGNDLNSSYVNGTGRITMCKAFSELKLCLHILALIVLHIIYWNISPALDTNGNVPKELNGKFGFFPFHWNSVNTAVPCQLLEILYSGPLDIHGISEDNPHIQNSTPLLEVALQPTPDMTESCQS